MTFPLTWPYSVKMMPPEWVYIYDDGTEFCPANWANIAYGLSREEHTMKRELSVTIKINGTVADRITALYDVSGRNSLANIAIYHRNESWVLDLYRVAAINFNSYTKERGYVSINLKENTFRQAIENNKDTEYTFPLPSTYMIDYSSVGKDVINTLSPIGGLHKFASSFISGYEIAATRSLSNYSKSIAYDVDGVPYKYMTAKNIDVDDKSVHVSVKLSNIIVRTTKKDFKSAVFGAKIRLVKERSDGTILIIKSWNSTSTSSKGSTFIREMFNHELYSVDITLAPSDTLRLLLYSPTTGIFDITFNSEETTMTITEPDDVFYESLPIRVVPIDWAFTQVLSKMGGGALTYNLTNDYFQTVLTSSDGLCGRVNPIIKLKYSDLVKTVKCLSSGIVFFTDQGITVDTIDEAYTRFEAIEMDTVSGFKLASDDTNVYSTIKVGYKADNTGIDEGVKEALCTNVFTIDTKVDKELDLLCPYIASPYTIESKIKAIKTTYDTTTDADNSIFIFAVHPMDIAKIEESYTLNPVGGAYQASDNVYHVGGGTRTAYFDIVDPKRELYQSGKGLSTTYNRVTFFDVDGEVIAAWQDPSVLVDSFVDVPEGCARIAFTTTLDSTFVLRSSKPLTTLYRDGTSSMKTTYYNLPISPMRILKANARGIGVSMVKGAKVLTFASSERTADVWSKMPWETANVWENNSVQSSEITDLLNDPLFSPDICEFDTCQRFDTISGIEPYKYYKCLDNNTGNMIYFYIDIISLQIGKIQSETVKGLIYDL